MTEPAVSPTPAAGGIVIRSSHGEMQVLVVHRQRYDDWSLPKGHVDPGETLVETAVREVREETGLECAPGTLAEIVQYSTPNGETKRVHYWVMTVVSGQFEPNDEVDRIQWVTADEATSVLSYDLDRDLVGRTLGSP